MKALAASALLIAALAGPAGMAAPAKPPPSLCGISERVVFTCKIGRSLASLCAARESLHYRYGLAGSRAVDVGNLPDWSNVRIGTAIGQGGGHQDHVRISTGRIHYTLFVGLNGSLADNPGKSYAGFSVNQGTKGETPIGRYECREAAFDPLVWLERVRETAPKRYRDGLEELPSSPFNAWF